MRKVRQFIVNWLFQDDVSIPAQQPLLSLPSGVFPPSGQSETLPYEQTAFEQSFPILDWNRMELTTFYLNGPSVHHQDSEPTREHILHPNKG